jgi:deazaflavin-dependent oxidoreductase (nitroreductase family)
MGWLVGHRFLLLTHTGRRTGLKRQTVLEVMEYHWQEREAIVMSGFGRDAAWLRNIQDGPNPQITMGREHFTASFRFLNEDEAAGVLERYERKNRQFVFVVRYVLSRLLGWKYAGSEAERHRVVEQLPLLGFRPLP